jgi:hypothetical protein
MMEKQRKTTLVAGAGDGAAVGSEHGSVTPDGACTSHIESGLVFGRQVSRTEGHSHELA